MTSAGTFLTYSKFDLIYIFYKSGGTKKIFGILLDFTVVTYDS